MLGVTVNTVEIEVLSTIFTTACHINMPYKESNSPPFCTREDTRTGFDVLSPQETTSAGGYWPPSCEGLTARDKVWMLYSPLVESCMVCTSRCACCVWEYVYEVSWISTPT